jgi:hypothetical protein
VQLFRRNLARKLRSIHGMIPKALGSFQIHDHSLDVCVAKPGVTTVRCEVRQDARGATN